jgi:hypothetical protein
VFYFVAPLIYEQEWCFVLSGNDGFGHDFADLCVVMAVRTGVSDGKEALFLVQYKYHYHGTISYFLSLP